MSLNISQYPKISGASALDLVPIWQTASGVQRAVQFQNLVPAVIGNLITSDSTQSANFSVAQTDKGKCFQVTTGASTITATLPLATSLADGFYFLIRKVDAGAGSVITSPVLSPISISLTTQGQGALIWSDGVNFFVFYFSTSASGGGGGGTPGGANTQVQYNNSGVFGGIAGATTDGTITTFAAGDLNLTDALITNEAAPATPAAGKTKAYVDSTSKNIAVKNDAGTVNHGIQTRSATASNWIRSVADDGTSTISQPAFSDLSGSATAAQMPAFTGDVTTSAGSTVTSLANIPNDATMAGDILATNSAAPATPAAGKTRYYVDSTSKNIAAKNDAGTVNHGIQTRSATASNWIRSIADDGSTAISQPAFSDLSGSATAGQMPAFTGDVTTSAGSTVTTNVNLPNDVTMAGDLLITNTAAPASPASGKNRIFSDSTDLRFHDINASGTIGTTVVKDTGAANNFLTAISASGVISKAQPSFANLSGTATYTQLPTIAPITQNDEAIFTVPDTGRLLQPNRLTLSGTERGTLAGVGRVLIADVLNSAYSKGVYGSGSFNLLPGEYVLQYKRLSLFGNDRLTEIVDGRSVIVDLLVPTAGGGGGTPGGSNTQVQYNDSGAFGADAGLTWDKTNKVLTVTSVSTTNAAVISGNPGASGRNNVRFNNTQGTTLSNQVIWVGNGTDKWVIGNDGTAAGANDFWIYDSVSGVSSFVFNTDKTIKMNGNAVFGWSSSTSGIITTMDTALARNAAGIVEINNSTAGQFADLKARNIFLTGTGPAPITQNDYTSGFTVPANGILQQPNRSTLSGAERAIVASTGRVAVSDQGPTNTPLQKVTLNPTSFIIRAGEYVMQYLRLALAGNVRATLTENARIINFEFRPPSHLVLAGAGL